MQGENWMALVYIHGHCYNVRGGWLTTATRNTLFHPGHDAKGLEISWVSINRRVSKYSHTHWSIRQSYKWKLLMDWCRMILNYVSTSAPCCTGPCMVSGHLWGRTRRNTLHTPVYKTWHWRLWRNWSCYFPSGRKLGNWEEIKRGILKLYSFLLSFALLCTFI